MEKSWRRKEEGMGKGMGMGWRSKGMLNGNVERDIMATKDSLAESKGREIRRSSMREDWKVEILGEEDEISPLDQLPRRGKDEGVGFLGELQNVEGVKDGEKIEASDMILPPIQ
ncbi:hypothetical protein M5K25_020286 [Dendrobium thyrsiflorum]|uniref:Uncharacterized protein n=1 Tax=Dendrobium thyrsiflorum TaxID=117978 RepID=A0ABD0UGB6_DENTH